MKSDIENVLAVKRGVFDQKVNVQCHDLFSLQSYKLFRQKGLFLVLVLGLGGAEAKFWRLYLPTRASLGELCRGQGGTGLYGSKKQWNDERMNAEGTHRNFLQYKI